MKKWIEKNFLPEIEIKKGSLSEIEFERRKHINLVLLYLAFIFFAVLIVINSYSHFGWDRGTIIVSLTNIALLTTLLLSKKTKSYGMLIYPLIGVAWVHYFFRFLYFKTIINPISAWLFIIPTFTTHFLSKKQSWMATLLFMLQLIIVYYLIYYHPNFINTPLTSLDNVMLINMLFLMTIIKFISQAIEDSRISYLHTVENQAKEIIKKNQMVTLTQLSGNIAHEVNNPLAIIMANAQILDKECDNERAKGRIVKILQQTKRIAELSKYLQGMGNLLNSKSRDEVSLSEILVLIRPILAERLSVNEIIMEENIDESLRILANKYQISHSLLSIINSIIDQLKDEKQKNIELKTFEDKQVCGFLINFPQLKTYDWGPIENLITVNQGAITFQRESISITFPKYQA